MRIALLGKTFKKAALLKSIELVRHDVVRT
jgi:hypothetical protein